MPKKKLAPPIKREIIDTGNGMMLERVEYEDGKIIYMAPGQVLKEEDIKVKGIRSSLGWSYLD